MRQERALKVLLVVVGLLFVAGIYRFDVYLSGPGVGDDA
jgi:hypothetical protein